MLTSLELFLLKVSKGYYLLYIKTLSIYSLSLKKHVLIFLLYSWAKIDYFFYRSSLSFSIFCKIFLSILHFFSTSIRLRSIIAEIECLAMLSTLKFSQAFYNWIYYSPCFLYCSLTFCSFYYKDWMRSSLYVNHCLLVYVLEKNRK